jgi:hypothetical protein
MLLHGLLRVPGVASDFLALLQLMERDQQESPSGAGPSLSLLDLLLSISSKPAWPYVELDVTRVDKIRRDTASAALEVTQPAAPIPSPPPSEPAPPSTSTLPSSLPSSSPPSSAWIYLGVFLAAAAVAAAVLLLLRWLA